MRKCLYRSKPASYSESIKNVHSESDSQPSGCEGIRRTAALPPGSSHVIHPTLRTRRAPEDATYDRLCMSAEWVPFSKGKSKSGPATCSVALRFTETDRTMYLRPRAPWRTGTIIADGTTTRLRLTGGLSDGPTSAETGSNNLLRGCPIPSEVGDGRLTISECPPKASLPKANGSSQEVTSFEHGPPTRGESDSGPMEVGELGCKCVGC